MKADKTDNEQGRIEISIDEFKLIKSFHPEFQRATALSNRFLIDWNMLMPVVEKIESMGFKFTIHNEAAYIERTYNRQFHQGEQISSIEFSKIEATYKTVVKFITWFTSLNHTKP